MGMDFGSLFFPFPKGICPRNEGKRDVDEFPAGMEKKEEQRQSIVSLFYPLPFVWPYAHGR